MRTKRFLSLLLAMTMIFSTMAFPAFAADGHCDDEANCLVCNVADLINALPVAEDITVENAAEVTDQIHAIDRIKFDLTDEQYDELLTLVDTGADESGEGLAVPVSYMEAVEAINELGGGGWFLITKKFVSSDGSVVDVKDAEVDIKITNIDTNAATTLTLATLGTTTSELGADYYTKNADGWTYKYMLPAGTYVVEEVADSGAIVDGKNFVTGYVTYNGENVDAATITVNENDTVSMLFTNVNESTICVYDAADETKEILTNAKITIATGNVVTGENTVATSENGVVSYLFDLSAVEAYYVGVSCEGYEDYAFTITNDSMEAWFGENSTCYIGLAKHINYYIGAVASNQEPIASNVTVELKRADTEQEETLEYNDGMANGTCAKGVEYTLTMSAEGYKTVSYTFTAGTTVDDDATTDVVHTAVPPEAVEAGITGYMISVTLEADDGESEETHSHPVCGATCDGDCGVAANGHEAIEWIPISQEDVEKVLENDADNGYVFDSGKNYYLVENVNMNGIRNDGSMWSEQISVTGGNVSRICLNGHTLTVYENTGVEVGPIHVKYQEDFWGGSTMKSVLEICDCGTGGTIDIKNNPEHSCASVYNNDIEAAIFLEDLAELNLYSGTITTDMPYTVNVKSSYDGQLRVFGGTIDNTAQNGIAVIGDTSLYGNANITAPIYISDAETIEIGSMLTYSTPIKIKYLSYDVETETYLPAIGDFTTGWATYMGEKSPAAYFANALDEETVPQKNSSTGELYFIRAYKVYLEYNDEEISYAYSDKEKISGGEIVSITYSLNEGCAIDKVTAKTAAGTDIEMTKSSNKGSTYTFAVPETVDDVTVTFTTKSEQWYGITSNISDENGWGYIAGKAPAGEIIEIGAYPNDGYKASVKVYETNDKSKNIETAISADNQPCFVMPAADVTVDVEFVQKPKVKINIPANFYGGTVTADKTEADEGEEVILTATPYEGHELSKLTVTDADSNVTTVYDKEAAVALFALSSDYTFTMPATDVTVDAVFTKVKYESPYTVNAVTTNAANVDKDTTDDPDNLDVYADDIVKIDVTVTGDAFTNADWTLIYDSSKFEYQSAELHEDAIEVSVNDNVISGKIVAPAAKVDGDEYVDGTVVATYIFKALPHSKEVTGIFNITEAHANNYVMAGNQDNTPAATTGTDVTILLVKDEDLTDDQIPSGTIEDKTTEYNAQPQAGNVYVLDEKFTEATVTYAANADGSAVVDDDGDGDLTDEIAALEFRTTLPTWKPVGTYTYYVKITGDGLATVYDSAVLTITPVALTPSARFEVDPAVDKVTIIPTLEGVIDGTHNGTVTITYADENGAEQTATYNASEFVYDGETTSVYTGTALEVKVQTSGDYTIKIDYTEGTNDNYTGEENTATVNVDKLTASDDTVNALEDTLTNVFPYDSTAHTVVVDETTLASIKEDKENWTVKSITDAYTNDADPTVTNVGDEVLVKVVFEDTTGVYNDVTVYVALKVTPAEVTITLDDKTKAAGEDDPELTYTIEVLLADGTTQNVLFGSDDLDIKPEREPGETAGTYNITASYVPNDNYKVTVVDADFVIGAPDMDGDDADVKIEVVDLSMGNTNGDVTPDYISDAEGGNAKRLILIYTDIDKAYFTYEGENFYDVTAAGYKYVDNDYDASTFVQEDKEYAHVYGLVVDAIDTYEASETYENQYKAKVIFEGSDEQYAPEDIIYDADINLSETEVDVNDYSMTNGIYNAMYDRKGYMISILKADTTGDKRVDTDDAYDIKADVEAKN